VLERSFVVEVSVLSDLLVVIRVVGDSYWWLGREVYILVPTMQGHQLISFGNAVKATRRGGTARRLLLY
jgi:hypothetical protein